MSSDEMLRFGPNDASRYLVSRLQKDPDATHAQLAEELRERWPETVRGLSQKQVHTRWPLQTKKALCGARPMPEFGEGEGKNCKLCGKWWARDPVLEVECPTCGQPTGSRYVHESPSGHRKSAAFQRLPPWGHDARDLKAVQQGAYGERPYGECSRHPERSSREPERETDQVEMAL